MTDPATVADPRPRDLLPRGIVGGILMGLANLVPGISGGTMLLAVGIYPRFIEAVARATSLKLDRLTLLVLGSVGSSALLAIVLLAGPVKDLVVTQRWVMYSLFIGLTLGGVPVVATLIREALLGAHRGASTAGIKAGAVVGFLAMAGLAWMQMQGAGSVSSGGWPIFFLGGLAGAAAMILPGVSGGYLLLVLGAYVPILAGIDAFRAALAVRDVTALASVGSGVILPVGLGVVLGIAVVSHALRWLFTRYRLATLGVLLGLLVGAVVGLWPFQDARLPREGELVKGQAVEVIPADEVGPEDPSGGPALRVRFVESGEMVAVEDLPTEVFTPSPVQGLLSLLLVVAGYGTTAMIGRVGAGKARTAQP